MKTFAMESPEHRREVELHGERLNLRPRDESEIPTYFRYIQDHEVLRYLNVSPPKTLEEEEAWFRGMLEDPSELPFSIYLRETEKLIGNCAVHDVSNPEEVSLGILIGEKEEWGKGYGAEAMRLMAEYARDVLKVKRVWLTVDVENKGGIRSYEKAGFRICERRAKEKHVSGSPEGFVMEIRFL